eukprot:COSAG06_NODE_560_length_14294_cov_16.177739_3_plen_103_part_00
MPAPPAATCGGSHCAPCPLLRCSWPTPYPDAEQWALGFGVSIGTLILYFILFGRRHRCAAHAAAAAAAATATGAGAGAVAAAMLLPSLPPPLWNCGGAPLLS